MKKPLLTISMAFACTMAIAQSAGPNSGKSFQSVPFSGSESAWIDVDNASASDDVSATFYNLPDVIGAHTEYLVASNFKFAIPTGYSIKGIEVMVESTDQNENTADHSIRLMKRGHIAGTEKSEGDMFFNVNVRDHYNTYGGPTDLWGEGWTAEDLNSSDFGIAISAKRAKLGSSTKSGIDDIRVIVYYANNLVTLPLRLVSFTATPKSNKVNVTWNTMEESAMDHFTVERSVNGSTFSPLGNIPCANRQLPTSYSYTDEDPIAGTSWYRLKIVSVDGVITYSKIVTVYTTKSLSHYLFPSPWKNGSTLFIKNPLGEKLTICFYSSTGELLSKIATSNQQVNTGGLKAMNGNVHYKILNSMDVETGSGKLLVY
jgi:hypothetical protein